MSYGKLLPQAARYSRQGNPQTHEGVSTRFFPFLSPFLPLSLSLSNFPGLRCLIFSGERWKPSRLPKASPGDVTSHHTRRLSHHSLHYTEALHNHVPQKSMNACRELFLTVIDKDA